MQDGPQAGCTVSSEMPGGPGLMRERGLDIFWAFVIPLLAESNGSFGGDCKFGNCARVFMSQKTALSGSSRGGGARGK